MERGKYAFETHSNFSNFVSTLNVCAWIRIENDERHTSFSHKINKPTCRPTRACSGIARKQKQSANFRLNFLFCRVFVYNITVANRSTRVLFPTWRTCGSTLYVCEMFSYILSTQTLGI